ncbi:hypothetical protein Molly5_170 [Maribacter phage Molly_5]|uniref:Uncharacterized protein n=1 Tax=Maribacter phage Molly_1 TaxID=2745685 RepID=A0A8E4XY40_9CAUD|nr:hypothetical protein M1M29_gp170 [Maribacter phage Molly_1]QQO97667.1 hypothetical protein Molly2_170 [Maribacter phage Molly_2]QQO97867.1 hypothetical protein Molly3_170 [Maribacter phage Molly_3]QQO98067.1 hypothetical protein Molly4_170 [Maribacter phage Molly_4]QQO98267.1 hypothetical protein Molly5_170 [Maribacter phage Molly_5]QQO97467.1 hypothetical protein Molly1_170 [Maribacter phage Molly_1]
MNKTDFTPEEKRAIKILENSFKKCEDLGIHFDKGYGELTYGSSRHTEAFKTVKNSKLKI